ncbi:protein associated with RNAse G/E [Allocatelliglobosispora scoriae]|uniref:Protein associated with RNAse G/E n=1 Tax=Allocatelliglobosispora scoriae TaxID=643052 RepID=A0A841C195_9ACTN|nr:DUF402 domain-containing protein [Allocatelliglobosispora scoriae]MBB5872740.1 protein associated with RNAse G/E [Allocatelliglobosispora scoriae]
MTGDTRVVYTKFDGSLHWHHVIQRLGEDRHGVWLGAPPGVRMQKGTAGREHVTEHPHVMLFRPGVWWTAAFNGPPHETEIYCDITSPVRWLHPGQVTMVDLDLDVSRERAGGRVVLWDEDEFDEHRLRWAYPSEVVDAARASAAWLMTALADGTEPFASDYRAWLELVS